MFEWWKQNLLDKLSNVTGHILVLVSRFVSVIQWWKDHGLIIIDMSWLHQQLYKYMCLSTSISLIFFFFFSIRYQTLFLSLKFVFVEKQIYRHTPTCVLSSHLTYYIFIFILWRFTEGVEYRAIRESYFHSRSFDEILHIDRALFLVLINNVIFFFSLSLSLHMITWLHRSVRMQGINYRHRLVIRILINRKRTDTHTHLRKKNTFTCKPSSYDL